jgi:hypothetical protein
MIMRKIALIFLIVTCLQACNNEYDAEKAAEHFCECMKDNNATPCCASLGPTLEFQKKPPMLVNSLGPTLEFQKKPPMLVNSLEPTLELKKIRPCWCSSPTRLHAVSHTNSAHRV